MTPEIRTVTHTQAEQCIGQLVLTFSRDPIARWIYPTSDKYLEHFPQFVKIFGDRAFDSGTAYCIDEFRATALWFPPGIGVDEEALVALLGNSVPASNREILFDRVGQMSDYHPQEPHWYLSILGTDPIHQSRGYGSALLRHGLATCDREQKLAYLEASSPQSAALYARHGFEATGTIEFGPAAAIVPMVRKPQSI
ncbi:GNAT family N-acetyltransferase [Zarconia navalis]|nr:GNAT family N-acetyltransferase [Zarconia navalis]